MHLWWSSVEVNDTDLNVDGRAGRYVVRSRSLWVHHEKTNLFMLEKGPRKFPIVLS